jgi:hypothetical protein
MEKDNIKVVEIVYRNYKNKVNNRFIIPMEIFLGTTEFYPDEQYLLKAYDTRKKEERIFAMSNILEWY